MSNLNLHRLVSAAKFILQEIAAHPDFQVLDYHPDLTLVDAQTALSYLQSELETNQQSHTTSNISVQS
jgi:hypothetical protein